MAVTPINLSVTNITSNSVRLGWELAPLIVLIRSLFGASEQGAFYVPMPIVLGAQALFQDSSGTVPVTADGDPVGRMIDQSGNGNHAIQTVSADRLIYRTDGTLHWFENDGTSDIEIPNSAFNFTGDQAVFIAAKHNTGQGSFIYLTGSRSDNGGYLFVTSTSSGRMRFIPLTSSPGGPISPSAIGTDTTVFGGTWNRTSGDISLRENGVAYVTSKAPEDVVVPVVTYLGSGNLGGSRWNGRIYGMVARSVLLTPSETANVEDYLAGLSGATL